MIDAATLVALLPLLAAETPPLLAPRDQASLLGRTIAERLLADPLDAIERQLHRAAERAPSDRMLPCVHALFSNPWSLPESAECIAGAANAPRSALAAARIAASALGAESPPEAGMGTRSIPSAYHALRHLDYLARGGDDRVRQALQVLLPPEHPNERPDDATAQAMAAAWADLRTDSLRLLETSQRTPMPTGDDLACALRVAAAGTKLDLALLARAAALPDAQFRVECDWASQEIEALPPELEGAIDGHILSSQLLEPVGWCVVGGPGPNRYDMGRIAAVFDCGGDDRYEWPDRPFPPPDLDPERVMPVQRAIMANACAIVDLDGNDTYVSKGVVGPGGALLGFAFLHDLAGDDRYEGGTLCSGAAMLGVAVLIDEAGNDTHVSGAWSQGAGFYGVGVLVDEAGADSYEGRVLCQGVGGPRAAGALVDRAGDDRYSTRGAPSAYDTPATDRGFSQGVGYGIRRDLPGGVGLLVDDAGNDRYESGEFSQGGAYFFSLGVLADRAGDDLYHGDRYAQGFAAHQAFGALLDAGGNDFYYSRTAAGQGAAWDESVAVLVDRSGNDCYRADGLSQGAAAQQAIAALVDLGGADSFDARGGATQGAGGGAEYHFKECGCYSLGVLLKLGDLAPRLNGRTVGQDMVQVGGSTPRDGDGDGETIVSSDIKPDDPRASKAYGVRIIRLKPATMSLR